MEVKPQYTNEEVNKSLMEEFEQLSEEEWKMLEEIY